MKNARGARLPLPNHHSLQRLAMTPLKEPGRTCGEGAAAAQQVLQHSHGNRALDVAPAALVLKRQDGVGQGRGSKLPAERQGKEQGSAPPEGVSQL